MSYSSTVPWQPAGLIGVGTMFFIFNLCLFVLNCVLISMRFYLRPGSFVQSFTDQLESLFVPSFVSYGLAVHLKVC